MHKLDRYGRVINQYGQEVYGQESYGDNYYPLWSFPVVNRTPTPEIEVPKENKHKYILIRR